MHNLPPFRHVFAVIFEAVCLLNLLVVGHEIGHLLAARWRGLTVERFSIWFGKPLWKHSFGGTEYRLGWIPFGGHASLPQIQNSVLGSDEVPPARLSAATLIDRLVVGLSGPVFAAGAAVLFAVSLYILGKPLPNLSSEVMAVAIAATVAWRFLK